MQTVDWTFSSGVIAVAETRLLTDDEFLDLLRLPTLQALLQRIKQVETYTGMSMPDSPDVATRTVEGEIIRTSRALARQSPGVEAGELMLVSRMFAELRAYIRRRLFDPESQEPRCVFFAEGELDALWNDTFDAREDLAGVVGKLRRMLEGTDAAGELADLLIDHEEIVYFLERAGTLGSEFIRNWAATYVRLKAALVVLRARLSGETSERLTEMFLAPPLDDDWLGRLAAEDLDRLDAVFAEGFVPPEGETIEVSRAAVGKIERMIDDRLTLEMTPARMVPFGPERLCGYLWGLCIENLNLRLITETFVVEGDRDETRTKLRMSYV